MDQKVNEISEKLFRKKYDQLNEREKKVADRLAEGTPISRNVAKDFSEQSTSVLEFPKTLGYALIPHELRFHLL